MRHYGSRQERGYGYKHQKRRKYFQALIDQGLVSCRRCGRPIAPGALWDLGHNDRDRTLPTYPEHRKCNRATNQRGRVTKRKRKPKYQQDLWI